MADSILGFYNTLLSWDTSVLLAVNGCHSEFWDHFMFLYSTKWAWVLMYASILYAVFRNFSLRTGIACVLCVVLLITLCDQTSASLIRPWIGRLRPSHLDNPISPLIHIVDGYRGGSFSFPSAHAANSWGLVFFVSLLFRRGLLTAFFVCWALLTCYSRLYLGVHYPTDLLVGMLVGLFYAVVVYAMFSFLMRCYGEHPVAHERQLAHIYSPVVAGCLTVVAIACVSLLGEMG